MVEFVDLQHNDVIEDEPEMSGEVTHDHVMGVAEVRACYQAILVRGCS